jgi:Na+-translocating ferredoxin:NAD+ oxidoreductase subunit A
MKEMLLMMVSAALVNNVLLARFLGLCPFMGVTSRIDTAAGMGLATTFVMTFSAMMDWTVQHYLLEAYDLGFLRIVTFILVIASTVQFSEMVIRKVSPSLFRMLGIYLPLITTNCAVLGVALLVVDAKMGFLASILFAFASALGFSLVMIIFAGLRERLVLVQVPGLFSGAPIALIVASLLAMAFMGFSGIGTI